MSYYAQNNTQQKSTGLFIVIGFHALLLIGLASGLGNNTIVIQPEDIKAQVIPNKNIPIPPPTPVDPNIQQKPTTVIQAPEKIIFNERLETITPTTFDTPPINTQPSSALTKPSIKKATKPKYPADAMRLGEEGASGLNLFINTDGRVIDANIFSTSGSDRLDDAAIKHALRNWSFTPCTEGNKAVACWFKAKMVWRIEDANK